MDRSYAETLRLLLISAPDVFAGDCFALKGGTAINFFVRGMPGLSVDLDVVCIPLGGTHAMRCDAMRCTSSAVNLRRLQVACENFGLATRTVAAKDLGDSCAGCLTPLGAPEAALLLSHRGSVKQQSLAKRLKKSVINSVLIAAWRRPSAVCIDALSFSNFSGKWSKQYSLSFKARALPQGSARSYQQVPKRPATVAILTSPTAPKASRRSAS